MLQLRHIRTTEKEMESRCRPSAFVDHQHCSLDDAHKGSRRPVNCCYVDNVHHRGWIQSRLPYILLSANWEIAPNRTLNGKKKGSRKSKCWARTAGGGRPEAEARPRSHIVIAAAAAVASAMHPAPTISAGRTVGALITTGHTPMRVEDPTVCGKKIPSARLPTIRTTMCSPLLSRIGERAMTAIADQTHDVLATTIGIASGSTTKGVPTPLRDAPIRLRTHADETKGTASRGAIGKVSGRVSKIATLGVTNQDTIGHRIRTLGWRLRTAGSGERIANPQAATPATAVGHPESRSKRTSR